MNLFFYFCSFSPILRGGSALLFDRRSHCYVTVSVRAGCRLCCAPSPSCV
jgi:hypothetical protein